jgi:hypothetical protein
VARNEKTAERQETSVMASIQDILQDARAREEQERVDAERRIQEEEQRRVDEARRVQEAEEARLKAEEEEKRRRSFEEQRHHAELAAMQEAALHKAKLEAEGKARLAEIASRQEHERQLHALSQDEHKKKLTMGLAGLGVLLFALAIGGGVAIKNSMDAKDAAEARSRDLQARQEQAEADKKRLDDELAAARNSGDSAQIAALTAKLNAATDKINSIKSQRPSVGGGGGGGGAAKPTTNTPKPACTCQAGDPLCSCL